MPKQVWQADDGRVFDTEDTCKKYEASNALLRPLFDPQDGRKIDIENFEDSVSGYLEGIWDNVISDSIWGDPHGSEIVLILQFHESALISDREDLLRLASAMQKLGTYLVESASEN